MSNKYRSYLWRHNFCSRGTKCSTFLSHISSRFPRFWKPISLKRKQISAKGKKPSFSVFHSLSYQLRKILSKFRCIDTLRLVDRSKYCILHAVIVCIQPWTYQYRNNSTRIVPRESYFPKCPPKSHTMHWAISLHYKLLFSSVTSFFNLTIGYPPPPKKKKKTPDVWFDVSWKRLYLHDLLLHFLNPHTST